ncbi:hypothetical protein Y1Q_0000893 [Alligator mississippiensis]|uniref:Uncharacterized protein n=1 Tax=Alligator mississippiensis TaxID=8496 RepID=A0A151NEM2_ALLMI|nr:hypothetical protein Y1Q_0000893 [Alligator mississippiensis]
MEAASTAAAADAAAPGLAAQPAPGQEGLGCDVEESRSVDVRGRPVALVLKVALGAFLPKGHTPLAGAGLDSVRVEVLFEYVDTKGDGYNNSPRISFCAEEPITGSQ